MGSALQWRIARVLPPVLKGLKSLRVAILLAIRDHEVGFRLASSHSTIVPVSRKWWTQRRRRRTGTRPNWQWMHMVRSFVGSPCWLRSSVARLSAASLAIRGRDHEWLCRGWRYPVSRYSRAVSLTYGKWCALGELNAGPPACRAGARSAELSAREWYSTRESNTVDDGV